MSLVEQAAREEYAKKNNGKNLGQLLSVSQQVVAGVNYRCNFASDSGEVEVVVFRQVWTDTTQVTAISFIGKGN